MRLLDDRVKLVTLWARQHGENPAGDGGGIEKDG